MGLNSRTVLAFFRRQTIDVPKSSLLPRGMGEPLNRSLLQLTPGKFITLIVIVLVSLFLIYLGLQYRDGPDGYKKDRQKHGEDKGAVAENRIGFHTIERIVTCTKKRLVCSEAEKRSISASLTALRR